MLISTLKGLFYGASLLHNHLSSTGKLKDLIIIFLYTRVVVNQKSKNIASIFKQPPPQRISITISLLMLIDTERNHFLSVSLLSRYNRFCKKDAEGEEENGSP